jgi:hypothetical protein
VQLKAERSGVELRHRPVQYLNNVLEQDHRERYSARLTPATFSLVLASLAHDRRLRRFISRSVRCEELNFRSFTPTFGFRAEKCESKLKAADLWDAALNKADLTEANAVPAPYRAGAALRTTRSALRRSRRPRRAV